jgi:hypothetical protein
MMLARKPSPDTPSSSIFGEEEVTSGPPSQTLDGCSSSPRQLSSPPCSPTLLPTQDNDGEYNPFEEEEEEIKVRKEEGQPDEENQLLESSLLLAQWERFTRGFGSKILLKW